MKVIILLNEKGGVGRSTVSLHLAAGLAIKGHRVLFVDADPQGNGGYALGLPKETMLYNLLVRGAEWKDVVARVSPEVYGSTGHLYAVTSNVETRNIANTIGDQLRFAKRVRQLKGAFDYVIVDTSPTPSLLHASMTAASDYVLMPTQVEAYSALEGLPDTWGHSDQVREAAAEHGLEVAQVSGIIPTMVRAQINSHRAVLDYLRQEYGDLVWTPQRHSAIYGEAALNRMLLFAYRPKHPATKDLWAIINQVEALHEPATQKS